MKTEHDLKEMLQRINAKSYKAFKAIGGDYHFGDYRLFIDHVQGDPYAAPSRLRARIDRKASGFTPDMTANRSRTIALADFLMRRFHEACKKIARGNRGSGKSGIITIDRPVQEILERSAMKIDEKMVEARFFMGLPAAGRRIAGLEARAMLFEELPRIVRAALFMERLDRDQIYRHIEVAEDADWLRNRLEGLELVGFVANDALLPRASGIDSRPLTPSRAVRFGSPQRLQIDIHLPNQGAVSGMGIAKGVTLIVGGGYHGKSTLLNALELGIYNHVPGDGRERVVSAADTVKIRAADGRSIAKTDISPFIHSLPLGTATTTFSTANASGSTSQAANITEAMEAGARVLLLDEDTSATNFMIRDHRMQRLVTKDKEPITPFIDKVRQLHRDKGISTILVMGGSGDYFDVAHRVIQMSDYQPTDVTDAAHQIAAKIATGRMAEGGRQFGNVSERIPLPEGIDPTRGQRVKISAPRLREISFGRTSIDLGDIEQVVDISQTRAIGHAIAYATRYMDGNRTLRQVIFRVMADIDRQGLDILTPYCTGDLARFRAIELAAAINRMRTLRIADHP